MRGETIPHWPMFRHDAQHTGMNPVGSLYSSPAVTGNNTVYVGSVDAHLYALQEGDRHDATTPRFGLLMRRLIPETRRLIPARLALMPVTWRAADIRWRPARRRNRREIPTSAAL